MKKFINLYILLICMVLLAPSCKKDLMDRYPQTSVPPELFFKTEEDLSIYINGLLTIPGRGNYTSDQDTDDKATTGAMEIKSIMTGSPSSQNITSGWSWGRLRNINYFLDNYNKAQVSETVKNHYAGLARFYRALFYIDKVKRYSDVPWYSKTLNPGDTVDLYKPRDPRALVMENAMADLAFAAANVRESVPTGTPNVWVVKLLLARTALYEGTYRKYHTELGLASTANTLLQSAAQVSEEIMNSGKFLLHSSYQGLFNNASLVGNKEVLLASIYDQDLKRSGSNSNILDYEMSPSRELVQTYLMKDGSRFTDQPGYQTFGFVQEFQNRDPRLSVALIYPGFVMATNAPNPKPYIQRLNKNFTGYHQLKGYINSTDSKVIADVDFPAYRYAEVLLTFAEAKAELGSLTQTDLNKSVNLIRSRATMPPLDLAMANGNPDPVSAAKYSNVTGANQGVILEIRREKRVEFAMEGYRFDDLMRWGAGKELAKIPEGMYFPGLGNFDLTGDGVPDIKLVDKGTVIPSESLKETNSLGDKLVYYKTGNFGEDVTVYLKNGTAGGATVTEITTRKFLEPKYYYRPIPFNQVTLNPALKQIFDWQ
ncbi:MAG TPA: RagB/SusD family nutrient uptake outer membrane protein [Niabella sp.]|nr:RagB/SusD family nutrient uptake outer membrane protein [Niabella sp.]HOZ97875.1 RagB/SusD family nutrient uptake outer membrane protein [Niabella sp.]HQW13734.1 RagB/SusD family nutrient uptake outer membrane protein [Niabella sp.]HQX19129.1 RagB/SusD family nutrient uptake outer membrane protein [Niabella sp.]HQX42863.1 RagB/SusD family nutrient uptake outer membrane protein [Niabella sp.]